jgi:hypothetical protein
MTLGLRLERAVELLRHSRLALAADIDFALDMGHSGEVRRACRRSSSCETP